MSEFMDLTRKQLDEKLAPLQHASLVDPPRGGWARAIRQALGMSASSLGRRIGISQPAVSQLEASEAAETISLASLKRLAEGMQCRLVYALVPESTLEDILLDQARRKAQSIVDSVSTSMDLEDQSVRPKDRQYQIETLTKSFLTSPSTGFWDD